MDEQRIREIARECARQEIRSLLEKGTTVIIVVGAFFLAVHYGSRLF